MTVIKFRCHHNMRSQMVECDSATSPMYAAKRAAAAFGLDELLPWGLFNSSGFILADSEAMGYWKDQDLYLMVEI